MRLRQFIGHRSQKGWGLVEALVSIGITLLVFLLLSTGWKHYQRSTQQSQFVDLAARELATMARRAERTRETDDETVNLGQVGPRVNLDYRLRRFLPVEHNSNRSNPISPYAPTGRIPTLTGGLIYGGAMVSDELRVTTNYAWEKHENRVVGIALLPLDGALADAMTHQAGDSSPEVMQALAQRIAVKVKSETGMNAGIFDPATDLFTLPLGGGVVVIPRLGKTIRSSSPYYPHTPPSSKAVAVFTDLETVSPLIRHFGKPKKYSTCQIAANGANTMQPQCPTGFDGLKVFLLCDAAGAGGGKVFQTAAGPLTVGRGPYEYKDGRRICGGTCDERKPIGSATSASGYGPPPLHCGFDPATPGKGCGTIDERRVVENKVATPGSWGVPYDPNVAVVSRVAKVSVSLNDQNLYQDIMYCDSIMAGGNLYPKNNATFFTAPNPRTLCCIPDNEREDVR